MPFPASTSAPTAALPSIPLLHSTPSFSQLLVRRRSSRRQLAHTPSTKTSSSSESAGTVFRRALAAVEEVGREKQGSEWRKREVGERAVESWREEVADEVALELEREREREREGLDMVVDLERMMEGIEGELPVRSARIEAHRADTTLQQSSPPASRSVHFTSPLLLPALPLLQKSMSPPTSSRTRSPLFPCRFAPRALASLRRNLPLAFAYLSSASTHLHQSHRHILHSTTNARRMTRPAPSQESKHRNLDLPLPA
jgi:hypothetical protein